MVRRRILLYVALVAAAGCGGGVSGSSTALVPQPGAQGGSTSSSTTGRGGSTTTTTGQPQPLPGGSSGGSTTTTSGGSTSGGSTTTTTGGGSSSGGSTGGLPTGGGSGTGSGTTTGGGSTSTGGGSTSTGGGSTSGGSGTGTGTTGGGSTSGGTTTGGSGTGTTGGSTLPAGVEVVAIDTQTLNVREGPGTNHAIMDTARQGEVYVSFERNGAWRRIWFTERPGWVHGAYTRPAQATVKATTADTLNVRVGPGTQYPVGGLTYKHQLRAVVGSQGDWRKIYYGGSASWVHSAYLADPASNAASTSTSNTPSQSVSRAGFIQLPAAGAGFHAYSAATGRWGTPRYIYGIERVGRAWATDHPSWPRIGVGDISLQNGGPFTGHASHQKGVDADFALVRNDSGETGITYHMSSYSRSRTQELVSRWRGALDVTMIFFNDSHVTGVQPWPNHDNHMHVRIRE